MKFIDKAFITEKQIVNYKSLTDLFSRIVHFKTRRVKVFPFRMLPDVNPKIILFIFYYEKGYGYYFEGLSDEEEMKLETIIGNLKEDSIETKNILLKKLWNKITKFLDFMNKNNKFNVNIEAKESNSILEEMYKWIWEELMIKKEDTASKDLDAFTMKYLLEKNLSVFNLFWKPIRNRIWVIEIHLNDMNSFPINENTYIEVVPNKYIRYLYNILLINYDKFENKKVKLIYKKFTIDKELKQLGYNFFELYKKTRINWYSKKAEQIVNILQNPLSNIKKWLTETEFENKSQCPKCGNSHSVFKIAGLNASFLLTFKTSWLNKIEVIDLGNISEIKCWACNFCFFNSFDKDLNKDFSNTIDYGFDYKCDKCDYYNDSPLLSSNKQIIIFYDYYEVSIKNDEYWNILELTPEKVWNVIWYQCVHCKHIKKTL